MQASLLAIPTGAYAEAHLEASQVGSRRAGVSLDPAGDLRKLCVSFDDLVKQERLCLCGIDVKCDSVHFQKDRTCGEGHALVAVHEHVVPHQALEQGSALCGQRFVVARPWSGERALQQTGVANAFTPSEATQERCMQLQHFLGGQVEGQRWDSSASQPLKQVCVPVEYLFHGVRKRGTDAGSMEILSHCFLEHRRECAPGLRGVRSRRVQDFPSHLRAEFGDLAHDDSLDRPSRHVKMWLDAVKSASFQPVRCVGLT